MSDQYILDGDWNPVPADFSTWSNWFGTANRQLVLTVLDYDGTVVKEYRAWPHIDEKALLESSGKPRKGVATISTVFLGLDHGWGGHQRLWESMVYAHEPFVTEYNGVKRVHDVTFIDHSQRRYGTRDKALAGHQEMVTFLAEYLRLRLPLLDQGGEVDLEARYAVKLAEDLVAGEE